MMSVAKDGEWTFADLPWWVVVICMGGFWPVGLWLLWKKMSASDVDSPKKQRRRISTGGWFMIVIGALAFLNNVSDWKWLFVALGGAALLLFKQFIKDKKNRFQTYQKVLAKKDVFPFADLAVEMGIGYQQVSDDLAEMQREGWLSPHAVVDTENGCYFRDRSFQPEALRKKQSSDQAEKAQPAGKQDSARRGGGVSLKKKTENAPEADKGAAKTPSSPYEDRLQQIRSVNASIEDAEMSRKIDRIEEITRRIFEQVESHPDRKKQISTFLNYYLPTTLKLLNSYSELEKQPLSRGTIAQSRQNIEHLMDQVVWAFEQQLDQMFESDALDIDTDIQVMQQMMQKDGLGGGKLPEDPFGLHGGAAVQRKPS